MRSNTPKNADLGPDLGLENDMSTDNVVSHPPVKLNIWAQGPVIVNDAILAHASPSIHCILVDLRSKYAELSSTGSCEHGSVSVFLAAGEQTLHRLDRAKDEALTCFDLPDYEGWDLFAIDGPSRYTLRIVMVKKETV